MKNSETRKLKIKSLKGFLPSKTIFVISEQTSIGHYCLVKSLPFTSKGKISDGEIMKEPFIPAAEALFSGFKNKNKIMSNIKDLQLLRTTVLRRVEDLSSNIKTITVKYSQLCCVFIATMGQTTSPMLLS